MSAGANHTCALDDAGTVWCWGQNLTGALGTGETSTLEDTPTAVSLTAPAVDVTAGTTHTCAALMDGSVRCWGGNGEGQVGNGNRTNALSPQLVSGVSAVVSVGAGDAHTCARASGGAVSCWGANEEGQLGNATIPTTGLMRRSLVPVLVDGIPDAATLAVGWDFACVVTTGGTVRCWGANASEQLGVMGPATAASVAPTMPSGVAPTALTAGGYDFLGSHGHTCAWSRDGAIACFGQNYYGEIGTGATFGNIPPTRVTLIETATVVAAGSSHTCAISSGTVYCWGRGDEGQLGNAATSSSAARVEVAGLP
jgi:alpha-tubulin suppressor-like RCC1 family protein